MRRSKQAWVDLIQEFEASALNQTEFCKTQGLNPKYFSLKRSRLLNPGLQSDFIKISPPAPNKSGVTLEIGRVRVNFGEGTSRSFIAELARELA